MTKKVYIQYDPLFEKILCVHDKPNKKCKFCTDVRENMEERSLYPIEEKIRIIQTNDNNKLSKL
jgi:hypothetical protein